MPLPLPISRSTQRHVLLVLTLALFTRVLAALYLGNTVSGLSGAQDEISYSMLGQRFASGHGMTFPQYWYPWIEPNAPQSYYSYTTSLYLAGIYTLFGYHPIIARLVTAILSTLLVWMIFLVARRLFGHRVAVISSTIAAVYAYLIFYGVTLVTETPFMLALLVAFYIALKIVQRSSIVLWISLGVALAVAVLLRMAVLFFVLILLIWLAPAMRQRRQAYMLTIPVLIIVLAILPFTVRNYRLWGRFMLLESQFGHVFWNGNHPGHQGNFHPSKVFPIPPGVLKSKNDAEITNRLLRMGIQNVLDDPGHFLLLTATRLREFFKFWPTTDSTLQANVLRVASFGAILPFAVIGLILNLRRLRFLAPVYLFMIVHTGVYAISWTMIRYRIPLDVFFIMFAAYTIDRGYAALRRRFSPRRTDAVTGC
jgi:4-amino-4-deoxy-L-arabinose transferase-like glycosyltransferase